MKTVPQIVIEMNCTVYKPGDYIAPLRNAWSHTNAYDLIPRKTHGSDSVIWDILRKIKFGRTALTETNYVCSSGYIINAASERPANGTHDMNDFWQAQI